MRNRSTTPSINSLVAWNSSSLRASEPSNRNARSMARSHVPSGINVVKPGVVKEAKAGVGVGVVNMAKEGQTSQVRVLLSQWLQRRKAKHLKMCKRSYHKALITKSKISRLIAECVKQYYHILQWSGSSWFRMTLLPWEILWPSWIHTWHWEGSTQRMATSSSSWPKKSKFAQECIQLCLYSI